MPESYEIQDRYKSEDKGSGWGPWEIWDRFPCHPDTASDAALNAYFGYPDANKKARLTIASGDDAGKTQFRLRRRP